MIQPRPTKSKQKKTGPCAMVSGPSGQVKIYKTAGPRGAEFTLAYYVGRERKREKRKDLTAAKIRAKEILDDHRDGTQHVRQLSAREVAVVDAAFEKLRTVGVSLSDAVTQFADAKAILGKESLHDAARHYVSHLAEKASERPPVTFSAIVVEFVATLKKDERSARYIEDAKSRLTRAASSFGTVNIADIKSHDIDRWLGTLPTGRTRNNYRAMTRTLFRFAKDRNYLPREIATEADMTREATEKSNPIGIYTPEQMETMLGSIEARWRPFLALGAFAGLRTSEIHRLDWEDIKFERDHIRIEAAKAKTASRRNIPLLPALRAILEPFRQESGPASPRFSSDRAMLRVLSAAIVKTGVERVNNGLRHSYASYRLAIAKSVDQVALEMGNSPTKVFQNYRELVDEKDAERWFSIMP